MRVVALFKLERTVLVEVEEAFNSLNILNFIVEDLPLKQDILEDKDGCNVYDEHARGDSEKPGCEAGTDVGRAKRFHCSGSRRIKPTPRKVCSNLTGNGSSILRRRRVICTSMTLSIG